MSDIPRSTPEQWAEIQAAVAKTRELDELDVRSGRRGADALHLIPRDIARLSKPVSPAKYRKS